MNCKESCLRIEMNLPFSSRLWSLERAQIFVDWVFDQIRKEESPPLVLWGVSTHNKGYYKDEVIYIIRNQSDSDKWRTLIHEMCHAIEGEHGMRFVQSLLLMRSVWREFNQRRVFALES